jgi:prephenate dehydrogenase
VSREWKVVTVAGVGLIGGSFALALRQAGFQGKIIGVSSPKTIQKALARGAIDEALHLAEAAAVADLVYLSQPISQILATLDVLETDALITDAGSTKGVICERARKLKRGRFVGGHPMAGKELRGVEQADADLFRGRPYVLTSREPQLEAWIERFGARLVILDPAEHDRLVAFVSHLPQLLSTTLASVLAGKENVAGPAAADLTRLALSPYDIWRDIFATNAEPIDAALSAFIARMEEVRTQLHSSDLEGLFSHAAASARALRGK